jgi:DNA uptake protein ComE-like DNA-binding protein
MSEGRKRATRGASVWLVGGGKSPSGEKGQRTEEAGNREPSPEAWLLVPKPSRDAKGSSSNGARRNGRGSPRKGRGSAGDRRRLASRLRRAESQRDSYQTLSADLTTRAEQLEAELSAERDRRRAETAELEAELAAAKRGKHSGKAPRRSSTGRSRARLDLNAATFEQLRGLGLSVTQSARLVAYRDVNAGFGGLDELDRIPGFSRDTLARLKTRTRVSARR